MAPIPRLISLPGESFFLFGPRGTGKSTLLRERYPDALFIDLLDPERFRVFSARPEHLTEVLDGNTGRSPVVIDEIQKVPHLLDVVHRHMEMEKRQFILTGSSSRKLKRTGTDLLAGRAVVRTLHPFMAAEMGDRFSLREALRLGMVPLVRSAQDPADTLKAYVTLYLREEVQAEGLVRSIGNFARFLEAASLSHGCPINISDVARDCQMSRKTVEGYFDILEDLLLGYRVPVFSRRVKRHVIQHPKFYYFDAGVYRSVRPTGPLDKTQEVEGLALEGLVAQHLRTWIAYRNGKCALSFWRTKSGVEVDFIVYGEGLFLAIEVKNGRAVHAKDTLGLRSFLEDYPESSAVLLYRGTERLTVAGIPCVPCGDFLLGLHPRTGKIES